MRVPAGRGGGRQPDRGLPLASPVPGQQHDAGVRATPPADGRRPAGRGGAGSPAAGGRVAGRRDLAENPHIRSGAEIPKQAQRPRDRPLRQQAEGEAGLLDPLPLRSDHLAVAVEGVEVGGDRRRVGADAMGSAARRGLADLVGELEQALDEVPLGRLQRRAGSRRPGLARLAVGFAQDAGDTRVRVLHVVDGVVARLAPRQLEVEVDRGVVAAPEHEPAGRVDADVVDQLVERDEVAAALRHLRALAAFDDVDEPHDQRLEHVGIGAERGDRCPHSRGVAVMVGAEHVDQPLEAALELVAVVSDVGGEVGRFPVGADQDSILVVAEVAAAQPQRPVAAVGVTALLEQRKRLARPRRSRRGRAPRTRCRSGRRSGRGWPAPHRGPARHRGARPPRRRRGRFPLPAIRSASSPT